jgi:hypothetical protein
MGKVELQNQDYPIMRPMHSARKKENESTINELHALRVTLFYFL